MGIPCGTGETECAIERLLGLTDQSSASPSIWWINLIWWTEVFHH